MSIQTHELHPGLAAEASFLDLSQPLGADAIDAIRAAIDAYPVLIYRGQNLTDTQLRDFEARFAPLEIYRSAARPGRRRLAIAQIGDISPPIRKTKSERWMTAGGWTVRETDCGTPALHTCLCRSCPGCCTR